LVPCMPPRVTLFQTMIMSVVVIVRETSDPQLPKFRKLQKFLCATFVVFAISVLLLCKIKGESQPIYLVILATFSFLVIF
jgi:hypothetical protein